MSILSDEALRGLRRLVARERAGHGRTLPLRELVALGGSTAGAGVTVDFAGSRALGCPMVVVRVPDETGGEPAVMARLSPRETQVARLIAAGLANKEIAGRLGVTLGTVKDHVHHILEKTGLPNRAAVAAAAIGRSRG